MTMFTRALNLDVSRRLWDLYFLDGFPILFKAALAVLSILKPRLLFAELEEIMKTLKSTQDLILNADDFVKEIMKVELPEWIIE